MLDLDICIIKEIKWYSFNFTLHYGLSVRFKNKRSIWNNEVEIGVTEPSIIAWKKSSSFSRVTTQTWSSRGRRIWSWPWNPLGLWGYSDLGGGGRLQDVSSSLRPHSHTYSSFISSGNDWLAHSISLANIIYVYWINV